MTKAYTVEYNSGLGHRSTVGAFKTPEEAFACILKLKVANRHPEDYTVKGWHNNNLNTVPIEYEVKSLQEALHKETIETEWELHEKFGDERERPNPSDTKKKRKRGRSKLI